MALELRQQLKLSQQLIMTPQLQMAIRLLQLSRLELVDTITQELEENPALEELQETAVEDKNEDSPESDKTDSTKIEEVKIEEKIPDDIDWTNYIDEYNSPGKSNFETEKKETPTYEPFIAQKDSLNKHLLWQMLMMSPTPDEEKIATLIAGNLNKDGYLDISIEELAEASNFSEYKVKEVLSVMQTFDPPGICARDLKECLLIQVNHFNLENELITEIINHHLKHLENKNYNAISRALKISIENVISIVEVIKSLEPRPGREFNDEVPYYITPDIFLYKYDNDFVIVINDDGLPKLRVNSYYRTAIMLDKKISARTKEYMQEKIRSASWLIRSIHQRQKTIYKVMESILKFQRDFFEKGVSHLKPMVLRVVAEDIDMHESTISRVTTNKYVHTPQGIFELKYFFNSSVKSVHGDAVASASVQDRIKHIIENENHRQPYSDDKISLMLKEENINIARRTVAKYREILRLLPSNKRKKI